jgi:hypothetical protein
MSTPKKRYTVAYLGFILPVFSMSSYTQTISSTEVIHPSKHHQPLKGYSVKIAPMKRMPLIGIFSNL